jgi:hypothetical protein
MHLQRIYNLMEPESGGDGLLSEVMRIAGGMLWCDRLFSCVRNAQHVRMFARIKPTGNSRTQATHARAAVRRCVRLLFGTQLYGLEPPKTAPGL